MLLVVPRRSPQRDLHALRVVVKPHDWTREAIRHRLETDESEQAEQVWDPAQATQAAERVREAADRLGVSLSLHEPSSGEALWLVQFDAKTPESHQRAIALVASTHMPQTWLTLGRLALREGKFWRRERGHRLHLHPVSDVHLPREVRASLRDLLRPPAET